MDIIKYRKLWLVTSILMVIFGIVIMLIIKPTFGIDFTGGTLVEIKSSNLISIDQARSKLKETFKGEEIVIQDSGENQFILRSKVQSESDYKQFENQLKSSIPNINILRHESIGASVGQDLTRKAIIGIIIASVLIIGYLAYAFRTVPRAFSSWSFGTIAVVALVHDLVFSFAVYTLIGKFAGYEIEGMIVVAALTVLGFSVHDTIVVYDRVRENMVKHPQNTIAVNCNNAVNQTIARSLNTSLTVILVLVAMLLLGGATIKPFILMLTLGIAVRTYSSIFIATPLLVWWYEKKK
jgi:preprotein translocase subunit SecF